MAKKKKKQIRIKIAQKRNKMTPKRPPKDT